MIGKFSFSLYVGNRMEYLTVPVSPDSPILNVPVEEDSSLLGQHYARQNIVQLITI